MVSDDKNKKRIKDGGNAEFSLDKEAAYREAHRIRVDEEAEFKAKLDTVMKAKARGAAKAKLDAEKRARQESIERIEAENNFKFKLDAIVKARAEQEKKREEAAKRRAEEAKRREEEAAKRRAEEERKRRAAEEARIKAEEENRRLAAEREIEEQRIAAEKEAEAKKKAAEEEAAAKKLAAEQEAAEKLRKAEEEEARKIQEELRTAKIKAVQDEQIAKFQAALAYEEAKRKAAEQAYKVKQQVEQEAEEAREKAEQEAEERRKELAAEKAAEKMRAEADALYQSVETEEDQFKKMFDAVIAAKAKELVPMPGETSGRIEKAKKIEPSVKPIEPMKSRTTTAETEKKEEIKPEEVIEIPVDNTASEKKEEKQETGKRQFDNRKNEPKIEKRTRLEPKKQPKQKKTKPDKPAKVKPAKAKKTKDVEDSVIRDIFAAPIFLHDRIQESIDAALGHVKEDVLRAVHKGYVTYQNARRQISIGVFAIFVVCAIIMILLDRSTVYEYSYNGKVLGYVKAQEDVTNVLDIAGEQLNKVNTESEADIEFSTGDNITFRQVDAAGKDLDDADTTVNKLAYMTDIEVAAYGVYDDNKLITIVKSQEAAEDLLLEVKNTLGTPDPGMELVSADFKNPLDIRPIEVLLTSVQSNNSAAKQMTEGGTVKFYKLIEDGETLDSIARTFSVKKDSIYDENNEKPVSSVNAGDKICIHKKVSPVSVEMVEQGRMREVVPFETIRKKSKEYYIGDEIVGTEGEDGVQIFEGTVTKVGGKVTKRKTKSLEVIKKKVDKVILVGATKRPKTAPTGTFKNPMVVGTYVITSRPGGRWGRMHEGYDMAARTGTYIYASDGGTVIRAGAFGGYGYCIDIQHEEGWISRYGHMSYLDVKAGDKVYQGQYIGNVGSTGHSTGPHLHFEIRHNGSFVNPGNYIDNLG